MLLSILSSGSATQHLSRTPVTLNICSLKHSSSSLAPCPPNQRQLCCNSRQVCTVVWLPASERDIAGGGGLGGGGQWEGYELQKPFSKQKGTLIYQILPLRERDNDRFLHKGRVHVLASFVTVCVPMGLRTVQFSQNHKHSVGGLMIMLW